MCCQINGFAQGAAIVTQSVAVGLSSFALSGRGWYRLWVPRVLPWASRLLPFQGENSIVDRYPEYCPSGHIIAITERNLHPERGRHIIAQHWAGRLLPSQGRQIIAITERNLLPERGRHIIAQRQRLGITNDSKQNALKGQNKPAKIEY